MKLTEIFNTAKRETAPAETAIPTATPAADSTAQGWSYAAPTDDQRVQTLAALAGAINFSPPADKLARLRELARLYHDASARLREIGTQRVGLLLSEQSQRGVAAALSGKVHELRPHEHLSKAQLRENLGALKTSVKSGLREIGKEAAGIAALICDDFRRQLVPFIDALEGSEIGECEKFHITYSPSALVAGMRRALDVLPRYNADDTAGNYFDPTNALPWLKL